MTFEDSNGDVVTEDYDLLIGADGVFSIVREKLQEHDPAFRVKKFTNLWSTKTVPDAPLVDERGIVTTDAVLSKM